ncbi:D-lactate dehydrogenase cytochrome mitochondrial [Spathaspora sp. JA1]|nr:D-lactate dehydrogenase cytochrome mitochondrial [Spathaspora sp. JA1]
MFKRSIFSFRSNLISKRFSSTSRKLPVNSTALFVGGTLFGSFIVYKVSNFPIASAESSIKSSGSSTLPLDQLGSPVYATDAQLEQGIEEIRKIFRSSSNYVVDDESLLINNTQEELQDHSDTYFNSHHAKITERPKYVVYPRSTQEVSEILKICHEYNIPVVPTSGRSSIEGHFIPTRGGISIDITNMSEIIQLNKTDLDVVVQGGVGWEELNDFLLDYNLIFSSDPGPGATISGILACNASGTNAYRYGETFKNVINLTVVLADGTTIKTKQRPRKSSAGYNLNSLFIGSEGTLGIITEATLRLNVRPANESVIVVPFDSIADAANAVNDIVLTGVQMSAIELLDDNMIKVVNASGETTNKLIEKPTLFLKIGGPNLNVLNATIEQLETISKKHNNAGFQFASDADERLELWSARKVALWSTINQGKEINENMQIWTTDAAVPISKLPQFLVDTKKDIDNHGLRNTLVAHIGDGNAHSLILYTPEQRNLAEEVVNNMVKRAISVDGTCTGEHGIGLGKREFLLNEVGQSPVDLMRNIKLALDPKRILNPDKVFKIDPNEPEGH